MIHRISVLIPPSDVSTQTPEGLWVAAHPIPYFGGLLSRWRAARAVFNGTAFAVTRPSPGEFEMALAEKGWCVSRGPTP